MRANLAAAARTRVIAVQSRLIRPRAEPRPPSPPGKALYHTTPPPARAGESGFQNKGCPVPHSCGTGQPCATKNLGLPKRRLALHGAGGNAVDESILCAEENDQLRDDGDQGQCQDTVPVETAVGVHGQLDEDGHRVLAGGLDVKQGTHVVVAAPHELEQTAGHQRGAQHRGDDLVQDLDRAAAVDGGSLVA